MVPDLARCYKMTLLLTVLTFCSTIYAAFPLPLTTGRSINIASCGALGDCLSQSVVCVEKCGCDRLYYYDETEKLCVLDREYLRQKMMEQFDTQGMIRQNAERVFQGIIVSVILFICCAALCCITACIYCCHINYTDRTLRKDIRALAEKLNRDGKLQKVAKQRLPAVAESCNDFQSRTIPLEVVLMDMVLTTFGVVASMAVLSCVCCLCMKISDMKMKSYIVETAKRKGLQVDLDKLDLKHAQSPLANDNCTIIVPDVGIVL